MIEELLDRRHARQRQHLMRIRSVSERAFAEYEAGDLTRNEVRRRVGAVVNEYDPEIPVPCRKVPADVGEAEAMLVFGGNATWLFPKWPHPSLLPKDTP